MNKSSKHVRISEWAHSWGDPILFGIVSFFEKFSVTPNALTIFGLVLSGITAVLISRGYIIIAGLILFPAGLSDVLDGPMARLTKKDTKSGSLLDSVLDQYNDIFVFLGIGIYYLEQAEFLYVILTMLILSSSLMVSYIKAKAKVLGVDCGIGPLGRFERVLLSIIFLIINQLKILIWLLVFLATYTVIRRFIFSFKALSQKSN